MGLKATKEIVLSVGSQGTEKAKFDLEGFERAVKKTETSTKQAASGFGTLIQANEKFGKIKEKVNQQIERFNFVTQAATILVGGGLVGVIGSLITNLGALKDALFEVEAGEHTIGNLMKIANAEIDKQVDKVIKLAEANRKLGSSARDLAAGRAGVDPSTVGAGPLRAGIELQTRANALAERRNGLEGAYVDVLRNVEIAEKNVREARAEVRREAVGARDIHVREQTLKPALKEAERIAKATRAERNRIEAEINTIREKSVDLERERNRLLPKTEVPKPGAAEKPDFRKDSFLRGLVAQVEAELEIREEAEKSREAAIKASDKAVADLRAKQQKDFEKARELDKQQRDFFAKRREDAEREREERFGEGEKAGAAGGVFALIGESDIDRIRGIREAIYDGITQPARIAKEATDQLAMGMADAAAAAILEGQGFRKAANEVLKSVARKALAMAIFEGAAALASLAIFDFRGAALHGKAAATFGIVAATTGIGAAATGGLGRSAGGGDSGSTGARSAGVTRANTSGGSGNGGTVVYTFNVNYNGVLRPTPGDAEKIARILNSQAGKNGAARLDARIVAA